MIFLGLVPLPRTFVLSLTEGRLGLADGAGEPSRELLSMFHSFFLINNIILS